MRFAARKFVLASSLFLGLFLALFFSVGVTTASAQMPTSAPVYPVNKFAVPNTDPNVPQNQHYFVQSVLIETLSATICILSGVDIVNPNSPCLGVNPQTNRLGFESTKQQPELGGVIGTMTGMIGQLYTPAISSADYAGYLSSNFGIAKPAYAAGAISGFDALRPMLKIWLVMRDFAYTLLVLLFIILGVGIMLRVHIDPRTVMTLQNQIPRVIICIVLITMSYAISAFMVDLLWLGTYTGINVLTNAYNPIVGKDSVPLSDKATRSLIQTPLTYFYEVFSTAADKGGAGGLWHVTQSVAGSVGGIVENVVKRILNAGGNCSAFNPTSWGSCIKNAISSFFGIITHAVMLIVVLVCLLVALFRVWFMLLKSYLFILFYTAIAPLYIVFGLIPGRPLGFEKWLRLLFTNAFSFVLVVLMMVAARVCMDLFDNADPSKQLVVPLVGLPGNIGPLLAFGVMLMIPSTLDILRDSLKVKNNYGAALGGMVAAGFAAPRAASSKYLSRHFRPATHYEEAGFLRRKLAGREPAPGGKRTMRYRLVQNLIGGIEPGKAPRQRTSNP